MILCSITTTLNQPVAQYAQSYLAMNHYVFYLVPMDLFQGQSRLIWHHQHHQTPLQEQLLSLVIFLELFSQLCPSCFFQLENSRLIHHFRQLEKYAFDRSMILGAIFLSCHCLIRFLQMRVLQLLLSLSRLGATELRCFIILPIKFDRTFSDLSFKSWVWSDCLFIW